MLLKHLSFHLLSSRKENRKRQLVGCLRQILGNDVVTVAIVCCAFASFCLSRSAFKFLVAASLLRLSESILAFAGVIGVIDFVGFTPLISSIVIIKLHSKLLISNLKWSLENAKFSLLAESSF